ncbi:MAG: thermonuclease family protein [Anaerolineae bacterium]
MNGKAYFTFLTLILALLACNVNGSTPTPEEDEGLIQVATVVDGDTIELADGRRLRYIGMNTPERDQPFYREATQANLDLVEGRQVRLEFDVAQTDRFGRLLAYVWLGETMVNLELVRQGYATVFTVPPNVKYEANLRAAQREAREAERGLWQPSNIPLKITALNPDAPGDDRQNPNGEWVEITNQGAEAVDFRGFTLKDEANNIYTFSNFTLAPEASVRLHSGRGRDDETTLYWGFSHEAVWNNNGDTAFLRDADGILIDLYAY